MAEHNHPSPRPLSPRRAQMTGVLPDRVDRDPERREKQDIGRALTPDDVRDPVPPNTHELRLRPTHQPDRTTTRTPGRPPETRTPTPRAVGHRGCRLPIARHRVGVSPTRRSATPEAR